MVTSQGPLGVAPQGCIRYVHFEGWIQKSITRTDPVKKRSIQGNLNDLNEKVNYFSDPLPKGRVD